jgi:hypothetical protein
MLSIISNNILNVVSAIVLTQSLSLGQVGDQNVSLYSSFHPQFIFYI